MEHCGVWKSFSGEWSHWWHSAKRMEIWVICWDLFSPCLRSKCCLQYPRAFSLNSPTKPLQSINQLLQICLEKRREKCSGCCFIFVSQEGTFAYIDNHNKVTLLKFSNSYPSFGKESACRIRITRSNSNTLEALSAAKKIILHWGDEKACNYQCLCSSTLPLYFELPYPVKAGCSEGSVSFR